MELVGVPDLFHGLSSSNLLDGTGFHDSTDDNRDSLLDLLSQSFPDMLMQPYGHLSSLPLDAPDLELCIQDEDFQESDSADDSVLQEFVSEVQNILTDRKRSNVTNAPELNESLSSIVPLMPNSDSPADPFTPIKKLWPDQLDLLTGPLLDGEDDDLEQIHKNQLLLAGQSATEQSAPLLDSIVCTTNQKDIPNVLRKPEMKPSNNVKPAIACVKPVMKALNSSKPMVSIVKTDRSTRPAIASVKPIVKVVKVEDESSDEIDIETVDDDCRSGAEVLSAKLADMECQAARVRILPRTQSKAKQVPAISYQTIQKEISCTDICINVPAKLPQAVLPSFPPLLKHISKPKENEPSPELVVEKIKQSVVTPRSSILIPHPVVPQSKGKPSKQETKAKVALDNSQAYDARTFDHDYCNMELVEPNLLLVKQEAESFEVTSNDLCLVEECIFTTEMEVPSKMDKLESDLEVIEVISATSSPMSSTASVASLVKRELPLSYSKWHRSPSPPYSQSGTQKARTRRRSSCSPSSVSSQSIYRSRSRSSSHGRKSRSQTHYRRKRSRGRSSRRPHQSSKRSQTYYSRSSSRSSFSSGSCSRSLSRSRSRSRCRSRSWEYKRAFNKSRVSSFTRDNRPFPEDKAQQIEERRVVYVGRLPDGTTKNDLRHRFGCFGPIQEVSVHFRDTGHNYGFVTFSYKSDAYEAVEHGNDDPNQPKFDLSFGGRRQFCKQRYADLDSQYNNGFPISRSAPSDDFDSLLRAAKLKLKKY